jgi:hypothetical protein
LADVEEIADADLKAAAAARSGNVVGMIGTSSASMGGALSD